MNDGYQLVQLRNGETTLFSPAYGEKMHPGLGPRAEAELLYVRQLQVPQRIAGSNEEFVIWDVGLGAAANAIATLQATRSISGRLRIVSFDNTAEPLEFALKNAEALGYVGEYGESLKKLLELQKVDFVNGNLRVAWEFHLGDFPQWIDSWGSRSVPGPGKLKRELQQAPHAIYYDAFSPAKNPAMWTLPVFQHLFQALNPGRPCALTTYSRSTMLRTTLLLAGFFVGVGHATGLKEETTIAANTADLISEPLNMRWLERAQRSDSAEPLREAVYSRESLTQETLQRLRLHPQFI